MTNPAAANEIASASVVSVMDWLTEYITQPHSELGRKGAICPFVKHSLETGDIEFQVVEWQCCYGSVELEHMIENAIAYFCRSTLRSSKPSRQALIVTFLKMPEQQWSLIDDVHRKVKDAVVAQGLMIGQFHPHCPAPAVHNPKFLVNRSPVPLFAIRHMQLHDILFLCDKPTWFPAYRARFGERYMRHSVSEFPLIAAYMEAERNYSKHMQGAVNSDVAAARLPGDHQCDHDVGLRSSSVAPGPLPHQPKLADV